VNSSELAVNGVGAALLMRVTCLGVVVVYNQAVFEVASKIDTTAAKGRGEGEKGERSLHPTTGNAGAAGAEGEGVADVGEHRELRPITRRDVLSAAMYNVHCGAANAVPTRVHFENIYRAAALSALRKTKFQVTDLNVA
jgi:hypothetical protein